MPSEVGDAPSLETSQARLDGARSSLIQLKMSLLTAGGWTGWPLKVPSHPNQSVVLRWTPIVLVCSHPASRPVSRFWSRRLPSYMRTILAAVGFCPTTPNHTATPKPEATACPYWPQPTCFQHDQVRGVISDVGNGRDVMDGDPEDEIFSIPPHQLDVVGRETDDSVVFLGQLPRELVCSLK